MNYLIGIDQSYTNTGLCIANQYGVIEHMSVIISNKDDDYFTRASSIAWHVIDQIISVVKTHPCNVALEGLAFASNGNATRNLAGLQFVLITQLREFNLDPVIVSPTSLKKHATNTGKATKQQMLAATNAVVQQHITDNFQITKGRYDVTDAYWITQWLLKQLNA